MAITDFIRGYIIYSQLHRFSTKPSPHPTAPPPDLGRPCQGGRPCAAGWRLRLPLAGWAGCRAGHACSDSKHSSSLKRSKSTLSSAPTVAVTPTTVFSDLRRSWYSKRDHSTFSSKPTDADAETYELRVSSSIKARVKSGFKRLRDSLYRKRR